MYTLLSLAFLPQFSLFYYIIVLIPEDEVNYKDEIENLEARISLSKKEKS